MEQTKSPIKVIATIGLVLSVLSFLLDCLTVFVPEPFLRLLQSPNGVLEEADRLKTPILLLYPAVALILNMLVYFLLIAHLKSGKGNAAGIALFAGVVLVSAPLVSMFCSEIISFFFSRLYGAAALGALGTVSAAKNFIAIATQAAAPALTAAAAMNWYREKYLPQLGNFHAT